MAQFWGYSSESRRKFSPGLWGGCPWSGIKNGLIDGIAFEDDFDGGPVVAAAAQAAYGRYYGFADTGGSGADAAAQFGALTFSSDGDNEGASIAGMVACLNITKGAGDLWFEARLKTSTIADTKHGIFVGLLGSATLGATVPIAADGTLSDDNKVGFWRLEGDGDKMDTYYKADSVTAVAVKSDAVTLVADTYKHVGMHFNRETNKLYFYDDGVVLADSKTIPDATGTDFPADAIMRPVFAVLNATGSSPGSSTIDWWAYAQLATP
jgi:hypothetical protein